MSETLRDDRANELLIFAKAPRIGSVKSRLAAIVGAHQARDIYVQLLTTLAARLAQMEHVTVCFAPDDGEPDLRPFFPKHWRYRPQRGADLGARLDLAIHQAFENGARKVAVIGSDCPHIHADDISNAWRMLEHNDVVFGPAHDGGYWLIALNRPQPALFREMSWSTETVLIQSQARAQQAGLKIGLMKTLADIDTASDWAAYQSERMA